MSVDGMPDISQTLTTEAKVKFLSQPASYPEHPSQVEVLETHMSWVFLTHHHAYKLKKPVCSEFLDLSSAGARRQNCQEELRLNRRLAPDVYLAAIPLTVDAEGNLQLDGNGISVDWLVKMHRLPHHYMLDYGIAHHTLQEIDVRNVALLLARFYQESTSIDFSSLAYQQILAEAVRSSLLEFESLPSSWPATSARSIASRQIDFLYSEPEIISRRVYEGRIIEGHGDLRPEHIYFGPKPAIIDCLEFSRELRILDPVNELAFLSVECERLAASWIGDIVLEVYNEVTQDSPPEQLVEFYKSYQAFLRAKIALKHAEEPGKLSPDAWHERARIYLQIASQHLP
jgi:aminoglycoside phosphotransferase family enzyme